MAASLLARTPAIFFWNSARVARSSAVPSPRDTRSAAAWARSASLVISSSFASPLAGLARRRGLLVELLRLAASSLTSFLARLVFLVGLVVLGPRLLVLLRLLVGLLLVLVGLGKLGRRRRLDLSVETGVDRGHLGRGQGDRLDYGRRPARNAGGRYVRLVGGLIAERLLDPAELGRRS